ncbi:LOW QUALITY PROTEIN: hypothetical protein CVT26_008294 [Gymnopilus dilepis]|uniref:Uncharacterized protein n=1 Tax=Gymnopilus dilepis TaxID=231916 RepID=A0A409WX80_9AGAR|nr:LOW QUALITY PROTEIN: hypothetical protein CVT26_008294 [Gymnopilus dilepis]
MSRILQDNFFAGIAGPHYLCSVASTLLTSGRVRSATTPSTEPTSSGSNPAAPNLEPSSSTPSDPVNSVEIQSRCNAAIESYCSGRLAKAAAILKIQQTIASAGPSASGNAAYKALEGYIKFFDNFDAFCNSAGERGAALEGPSMLQINLRENSREVAEEDDGEEPPSRPRTDRRRFPWVVQEENSPSNLSPELWKMIAALENFARDPKLAKTPLLTRQGASDSLTLRGPTSLLDASSTSTTFSQACIPLQPTPNHGSILGRVKLHSDFKYVEACLFVFPNKRSELEDYGQFVKQLSTSVPAEYHSRIIHFDKAVRLCVAQRRNMLLTDYQFFMDLSLLGLHSGRVAEAPGLRKVAVSVVAGKLAGGGIVGSAPTLPLPATMPTFAPSAGGLDMSQRLYQCRRWEQKGLTPRAALQPPTTDLKMRTIASRSMLPLPSTISDPLPSVPVHELNNIVLSTTITSNPDLLPSSPRPGYQRFEISSTHIPTNHLWAPPARA